MGYREGTLKIAEAPATNQVAGKPAESNPPPKSKAPVDAKTPPTTATPKTGYSLFGWMMMAGVPILICGAIILLLGRKRDA